MALFSRKPPVAEEKAPSTSELAPEERQEIERLLDEGLMPLGISRQTGVDIRLIRTVKLQRDNARARASPTTTPMPKAAIGSAPSSSLERVSRILNEGYERELIEEQIDAMKKRNVHTERLRQIELADKMLELQRKKQQIELEALYDGDDETQTYTQAIPAVAENMAIDDEDESVVPSELPGPLAEYSWVLDIIKFWTMLGNKAGKAPATNLQQQQLPSNDNVQSSDNAVDASQPFDIDEIRKHIAKSTPAERALAKKLPPSVIRNELKKRFPGISPENIKTVIFEIRHYVDNAERAQEGNEQLQ